jgi:predicted O-methyltransferase YrrM
MMTLDELLEAQPPVHPLASTGTWSTSRSCYEFIAAHVQEGSRTLETGCGTSTALFALRGCIHTAVFLSAREGDRLRTWAEAHSVSLDRVTLLGGAGSDVVLPTLEQTPVDFVMIDGGHGYPLPQLDWLYAGSRLRRGGLLVVDDLQLYAPHQLASFLDADPRWTRVDGNWKWCAWRRESEGPLAEGHTLQRFIDRPSPSLAAQAVARLRPLARRLLPQAVYGDLRRRYRRQPG